jgi:glutamate-1-semialdehyde 2,1-aminomutase
MLTSALSPRSSALLDTAARYIPGGVNTCRRRSEPKLCFERGAGAYLWDLEGRRYIDFHAAYGAILLGHSHPAVTERVAATMRDQVLFGVGVTELEVDLARRIVSHLPGAEQVVVCNSGSEATYHALRLARGVTGRERIVKLQGSYNGFHDYVLRNVLSAPEGVGRRDPHSSGMLQAAVDATLVGRYNDLDDVERLFAAHPEEIAAIILEPIGHNAPGIAPEPGFLEGLRALCDRTGALLVFDEVISGFRHGLGGFQEVCGVTPDLTTLGKAIANGFPLAAVAGRREHMERYSTTADGDVHFGGTFNGNAVAVAAGVATIEHLETHPVHAHIYALGDRMRDGLRTIADEAGIEAYVGGFGSLFVLCFMEGPMRSYEDALRNDNVRFLRYRRALVERGVFEMPESLGRSHISAAHTAQDVDTALDAARDALRAALA